MLSGLEAASRLLRRRANRDVGALHLPLAVCRDDFGFRCPWCTSAGLRARRLTLIPRYSLRGGVDGTKCENRQDQQTLNRKAVTHDVPSLLRPNIPDE